ncbi:tetratricopeptide repeat-containing sensor histidine kinase [Spongiivirga citrea]|uniref:histidine kinase n=1 Tax=Spongiivirga citrea TaxID=1481457 RepID=A0A6M0CJB5_9FLAO|nr:ATP-binding protein [Spongiivirga citrea]NER18015.1 hypothetical protein [Spongiivirga citrea]
MKKIISIITLVLCSLTLNAQQKFDIDYYKKILNTTSNDQEKLEALDSLVNFTKEDETDEYVSFSKQFIDLTEKLELYDRMIARGTHLYGTIRNKQNQKEEADKLFDRLETHLSKAKDSSVIGKFYLRKAMNARDVDNEEAIALYTKAIQELSSKDSVQVADSYLYRGQCNDILGKYVEAIKDYENAGQYYEQLKDTAYFFRIQQNISIIYSRNGFTEKAAKIQNEVIENAVKAEDYGTAVGSLVNQAIDLGKQNKLDEQQKVLERALAFNLEKLNDDIWYDNYIRINLVKGFSTKKDKKNASIHLNRMIEREPETKNIIPLSQHNFAAKAYFERSFGNIDKAIGYFKKREELLEKMQSKEVLALTKRQLGELYEEKKDYNTAYTYYKDGTTVRDSIFNANKTNTFLFYQTLYETERKEKELIKKTSEVELLEQKNSTKQRVLVLSIAGISLLFLIVYLIRNRAYLKKTKQQQEEFSQQLLQSQEEERKRISKDLHDSLGQSLLLIKNKVILNDDKETGSIVNDAIEEVRSISRALHPFQLEELGLTKAIENVVNQLDESTDIFISSEVDNIQNVFESEQEVNIFRIVQESLNNIIKHANAQAARVEVIKEAKQVQIIIKDNGKGFDFSERYNDFKSLGLKTLKERTKLLNGSMKIDSEKNKGTTLAFTIPLAA